MPARGWRRPLAARFEEKVALGLGGCEVWLGMRSHGYGYLWHEGKMLRAHRVAYELHVGAIPDGMIVMHTCDNRACVNPKHLRLGTASDNMRDCVAKGRHGNQWRKQLDGERRERAG